EEIDIQVAMLGRYLVSIEGHMPILKTMMDRITNNKQHKLATDGSRGQPITAITTQDVSTDKADAAQDDDLDGGHNDNTTTIILRGHLFDSQLVNSVLDIVEEHKSVAHFSRIRLGSSVNETSEVVEQLSEGLQYNPVVDNEKDSDAIITRDGNPSIIINVPSSKSSAMESQEAMDNYKNNPKRPVFDRQRSMQGSSAGAGSDFFGKYQKHRTIELERLRKMDEDWDKMQKDLEYHPEEILFKRMEQTQNIQKIAVFRGGTGLNSAKEYVAIRVGQASSAMVNGHWKRHLRLIENALTAVVPQLCPCFCQEAEPSAPESFRVTQDVSTNTLSNSLSRKLIGGCKLHHEAVKLERTSF
ncbi:hypothetical protein FOZ63_031147, partial [Perkinsus olseni]